MAKAKSKPKPKVTAAPKAAAAGAAVGAGEKAPGAVANVIASIRSKFGLAGGDAEAGAALLKGAKGKLWSKVKPLALLILADMAARKWLLDPKIEEAQGKIAGTQAEAAREANAMVLKYLQAKEAEDEASKRRQEDIDVQTTNAPIIMRAAEEFSSLPGVPGSVQLRGDVAQRMPTSRAAVPDLGQFNLLDLIGV